MMRKSTWPSEEAVGEYCSTIIKLGGSPQRADICLKNLLNRIECEQKSNDFDGLMQCILGKGPRTWASISESGVKRFCGAGRVPPGISFEIPCTDAMRLRNFCSSIFPHPLHDRDKFGSCLDYFGRNKHLLWQPRPYVPPANVSDISVAEPPPGWPSAQTTVSPASVPVSPAPLPAPTQEIPPPAQGFLGGMGAGTLVILGILGYFLWKSGKLQGIIDFIKAKKRG
jgi:hypothetical protein